MPPWLVCSPQWRTTPAWPTPFFFMRMKEAAPFPLRWLMSNISAARIHTMGIRAGNVLPADRYPS